MAATGKAQDEPVRERTESLGMHFAPAAAWRDSERPVFVRGEGCYLWDEHADRYLDGLSGLFCVNIGHGRADIAAAAAEQARRLAFATNWSAAHPPATEAAGLISSLAPGDLDVVFFVNSGSEANETAIKFARQYHQGRGEPLRIKILSRQMAYHGTTLGALSATGIPRFREPFLPLLPWFRQVPNTYGWEQYGDTPSAELPCLRAIEEAIVEEGPETIALLIAEPVQNVGGVLVPPDDYWRELRSICDRYGILLAADDVICAFGRLGRWFGFERVGGQPDIVTFAKGATSAYAPLGGMIVRRPLVDELLDSEIGTFTHGATFGGHPVSTAVAVANIKALRGERIPEQVGELESYFRAGLDELARRHSSVKEVRGQGYLYGLELTADRDAGREFTPSEKTQVCGQVLPAAMSRAGLFTRADDRGPAMLMLAPPLVADRVVLDDLFSMVDSTLSELGRWLATKLDVTAAARK
jgi:adenosylmethionine-8-amino-7-oxononanoate aminotransferase